jgi:hypothetical protein
MLSRRSPYYYEDREGGGGSDGGWRERMKEEEVYPTWKPKSLLASQMQISQLYLHLILIALTFPAQQ